MTARPYTDDEIAEVRRDFTDMPDTVPRRLLATIDATRARHEREVAELKAALVRLVSAERAYFAHQGMWHDAEGLGPRCAGAGSCRACDLNAAVDDAACAALTRGEGEQGR